MVAHLKYTDTKWKTASWSYAVDFVTVVLFVTYSSRTGEKIFKKYFAMVVVVLLCCSRFFWFIQASWIEGI